MVCHLISVLRDTGSKGAPALAKTAEATDQSPNYGFDADAKGTLDPTTVLPLVGVAVYEWDIVGDRLIWSRDAADQLKSSPDSISTGLGYARHIDPNGPAGRYDAVTCTGQCDEGAGVSYHIEYRFITDDPREPELWIEDNGFWYAGPDGRPALARGAIRAINERRARDERLIYRSDHDDLTGGLNRPRLIEELGAAIETAERSQTTAAFAIVAVDNLAVLNDAYGFDVADEIIAGVAKRIRREMRADDAIGRLSGNKLGIVLNTCTDSDLHVAVERFSRAVGAGPISTETGSVAVTASIGGVVAPCHGSTPNEALIHAQEALDEARCRGCSGIVVYEPSAKRDAARKNNVKVAAQIVAALNEGRIALLLQPIVAAGDGKPAFHEALCRINLDDGTQIAAADFIETAERLGIVRLVDHRTLDLAVARLVETPSLVLSINVSTVSAYDGSWFARLDAHLRRHPGLAQRLIVEITETMAIRDVTRAIDFVRSVRDLGCRVAIDDFGAGHTSFRNLRTLGADIVKIDGAFVERLSENEDDQFFVATLVSLARRIGLETVAERVSKDSDARILKGLGVDYLQGHLFGLEDIGTEAGITEGRQSAAS